MDHKKKGDMKEEEYFESDTESHKHNKGGSGGLDEESNLLEDNAERFYAQGLDLDKMALLEDTRFLSEALEVIFLLMEASDPTFPSDSEDGLTNEEWDKRLRMARTFLETHEKRILEPGVKARLLDTYLKKDV